MLNFRDVTAVVLTGSVPRVAAPALITRPGLQLASTWKKQRVNNADQISDANISPLSKSIADSYCVIRLSEASNSSKLRACCVPTINRISSCEWAVVSYDI